MESEVSNDYVSDDEVSIASQARSKDDEDMSDCSSSTSSGSTTPISSAEENSPSTDEEGVSSNSKNSPEHRFSPSNSENSPEHRFPPSNSENSPEHRFPPSNSENSPEHRFSPSNSENTPEHRFSLSKSTVIKKKTKERITKPMSEPPSILRLRVSHLRTLFGENKPESKLIKKLIHEVNCSMGSKKHPQPKYKKNRLKELKTPFGFQVVGYTQKTKLDDPFCSQLGYTRLQSSMNRMTYYFRENEIFVLTIRQGWQPIKKYCCLSFPDQINSRLTTNQGNSVQKDLHLTGNVNTSQISRRDPSNLFERLDSVTVEKTRVIRTNSSVFNLEGFKPSPGNRLDSYKIKTGEKYVHILKRIDAQHMPEILDHLAKICNKTPTETTDGEVEEDIESHAYAKSINGEEKGPLDEALYQLLFDHLTSLEEDLRALEIFDLSDKFLDAYQTGVSFQLVTPSGESLAHYTSPPSSSEVFSKLQKEFQGKELKFHQFISRLKRVQIHYHPQGRGSTVIRRGLLQLINGEMKIEGESYWRIRGLWFYLLDEFYLKLNDQFLDLLNQNRVLSSSAAKEVLPLSWSECGGVEDYVNKYMFRVPSAAANHHYFLPPDLGDGDQKKLFDLLVARKIKNRLTIHFVYIFQRFDAGLRSSSIKILKSLEEMFKSDDKTEEKELFELFSTRNFDKEKEFRHVFEGYNSFKDLKEIDKLLVFACPKGCGGDSKPEVTFEMEKRRPRKISKKRLATELLKVPAQCQEMIRRERTTAGSGENAAVNADDLDLAEIVIDKLVEEEYCKMVGKNGADISLTGKLLRLIDDSKFELFEDKTVDSELFKVLKKLYLTHFPGFFHKLECIEVYRGADRNLQFPKLKVRFANIN